MKAKEHQNEEINYFVKKLQQTYCDHCFEKLRLLLLPIINYQIRKVNLLSFDENDLEQEALLVLLTAIETYDMQNNASFTTYYSRIVYNRFITLAREQQREYKRVPSNRFSLDEPLGDEWNSLTIHDRLPSRQTSIEDLFMIHEAFSTYIDNLSHFERICILEDVVGQEEHQIAKRYGRSCRSIGNATARCKRKWHHRDYQ